MNTGTIYACVGSDTIVAASHGKKQEKELRGKKIAVRGVTSKACTAARCLHLLNMRCKRRQREKKRRTPSPVIKRERRRPPSNDSRDGYEPRIVRRRDGEYLMMKLKSK